MVHAGLRFGAFIGPYHPLGENPTLALHRDLELIEWLDDLGYDEAWIGEHHSGGWETVGAPDLMIAAAAERTKRIMLGSGVTSLPYHHPLMVANRFIQLDHMTRGRVMLGCGPGALASDAVMLGVPVPNMRKMMSESLDVLMPLLRGETVSKTTDWFEMKDGRVHLLPYSDPCFHVAVATTATPSGITEAGKHGLGVLSLGAAIPGGMARLPEHWKVGEETAEKHGKKLERKNWRVVLFMHCAETDELALRQVREREAMEDVYWTDILGRPGSDSPDRLGDAAKAGIHLIGSPQTIIKHIEHIIGLTQGGFGTVLFRAHEWATKQQTYDSYELIARHVMPHFQGSTRNLNASAEWIKANREALFNPSKEGIRQAFIQAGKEVPTMRTFGGMIEGDKTSS